MIRKTESLDVTGIKMAVFFARVPREAQSDPAGQATPQVL